MKLFAYGELCKAKVLRQVLGRVPAALPALLSGYRRRKARHGFFMLEPADDTRVAGLLLCGLEPRDMERLDEFEQTDVGLYRRGTVRVRTLGTDTGDPSANVYLAPESDVGTDVSDSEA